MKDLKNLLLKRKLIKAKKPHFVMQDAHKLKRLKDRWTKPRGIDSKMRLNLKGYHKSVEPGYGSPKEVRGLDRSGLEPIIVSNVADLEKLNSKKQGAIINGKMGNKKRIEVLKKAKELDIKVLNIKNTDNKIAKIEQEFKARKEDKAKTAKKKEEKKAKESKKDKKEDKLAEKVTEEEKAAAEKKEKDKVLTKKEN